MKKLIRNSAPECLSRFRHGRDNWSVIYKNSLTDEIWAQLNGMQHGYCAYCECKLDDDNSKRHIEHFLRRESYSHLTFDWGNLFGSCNNPNRCGKFKDNSPTARGIDLNRVCKPDGESPIAEDLLIFLSNGDVKVRIGLSDEDTEIARNTIRVFNLAGDTSLVNARKAVIRGEKALSDEYWETISYDDVDLNELLCEEYENAMSRVASSEFSTALKHIWKYNDSIRGV